MPFMLLLMCDFDTRISSHRSYKQTLQKKYGEKMVIIFMIMMMGQFSESYFSRIRDWVGFF